MTQARCVDEVSRFDRPPAVEERRVIPALVKYRDVRASYGIVKLICVSRCIFTAQCTLVHMRGLGIACRPSVRPSVRL